MATRNEKTVITEDATVTNNTVNVDTMTVEQLIALQTALNARKVNDVAAIDAEIATLKAQIAPLNEKLGTLILNRSKLSGKAVVKVDGEHTRTAKQCDECGQFRHGSKSTCSKAVKVAA